MHLVHLGRGTFLNIYFVWLQLSFKIIWNLKVKIHTTSPGFNLRSSNAKYSQYLQHLGVCQPACEQQMFLCRPYLNNWTWNMKHGVIHFAVSNSMVVLKIPEQRHQLSSGQCSDCWDKSNDDWTWFKGENFISRNHENLISRNLVNMISRNLENMIRKILSGN